MATLNNRLLSIVLCDYLHHCLSVVRTVACACRLLRINGWAGLLKFYISLNTLFCHDVLAQQVNLSTPALSIHTLSWVRSNHVEIFSEADDHVFRCW